ncbi:hypothetical protein D3C84_884620 [compost metagenome]
MPSTQILSVGPVSALIRSTRTWAGGLNGWPFRVPSQALLTSRASMASEASQGVALRTSQARHRGTRISTGRAHNRLLPSTSRTRSSDHSLVLQP